MAAEPNMVCPYTGLKYILEFHGEPGRRDTFWKARGLFDPCRWFDSEDELVAALSTRNGEQKTYKRLTCPYTARPVSVVKNERLGKFRAVGCFDPTQLFPDRVRAEFALSTRNGRKPDLPERRPTVVVQERTAPPPSTCSDLGSVGDEAMEFIDELTKE